MKTISKQGKAFVATHHMPKDITTSGSAFNQKKVTPYNNQQKE
jgi:hypothetical protein